MDINLTKKFSIPHYDNLPNPTAYFEGIKNASQDLRNEIYDIYFGKIFRFKYREQEAWDSYATQHNITYGNVMGVEASDEQVDNLFKIQREFKIEISLVINQLNIPVEIFYGKNNRVLGAFLDWLGGFYDRGLRSCTLANNHLMRSGLLQKKFPEMKWKNTVNQQVSTAQQVIDYLCLGYQVIQLDRSLNRNIEELKRIKVVVEDYNKEHPDKNSKTSLLVWEDCLPSCPFKREHDDLQMYVRKINYHDVNWGFLTCRRWTNRNGESIMPRFGTNCYWSTIRTFEEYANIVDLFKYSGRLTKYDFQTSENLRAGWFIGNKAAVESFSSIIENELEPIHLWTFGHGVFLPSGRYIEDIEANLKDNFWMTSGGQLLEQRLKNCNNQCYKCHLCERTYKMPDIDSAIEL